MALLAAGDAWPSLDSVGELLQLCRDPPVAKALGNLFPTPETVLRADQALRGAREQLRSLESTRQRQACSARDAALGASTAAGDTGKALDAFQERCGESAGSGAVQAWELQPVVQELAALAAEAVWVQRLKQHIQGTLSLDAALASAEESATAALRIASSPAAYPRVSLRPHGAYTSGPGPRTATFCLLATGEFLACIPVSSQWQEDRVDEGSTLVLQDPAVTFTGSPPAHPSSPATSRCLRRWWPPAHP